MQKKIVFGNEARAELSKGLDVLYKAVASTLGPGGKNIIIKQRSGEPVSTKDGVTVAKFVMLSNEIQDAGAQAVKQAALKANEVAGDGTSSSVVLAKHIYDKVAQYCYSPVPARGPFGLSLKAVAPLNPHHLKETLDRLGGIIGEYLGGKSTPVSFDDYEITSCVGSISGNSKEVGETVAKAYQEAGEFGTVVMKAGESTRTRLEIESGYTIEAGYEDKEYYPGRRVLGWEEPKILVYSGRIRDSKKFTEFLNKYIQVYKTRGKDLQPLILIGDALEGDAQSTLKAAIHANAIIACSISAPYFGDDKADKYADLATYTGTKVLYDEDLKNINNLEFGRLGTCKQITILGNQTIISGGDDENIQTRVGELQSEIEKVEDDNNKIVDIRKRITKLNGKFATIHVGGLTQQDLFERGFRYEDAINAIGEAVRQGVVPGGAVALKVAVTNLRKTFESMSVLESAAFDILDYAATMLIRQILTNAGISDYEQDKLIKNLLTANSQNLTTSYNYKTMELVEATKIGVLDPVGVITSSLDAAISAASVLALTEGVIADDVEAFMSSK